MVLLLFSLFRLPQSSTAAPMVDRLYDFIFWTSLFCFVVIVFGKLAFLLRFRRRRVPEHKTPYITGHTATEISVAALLLILVMVIFYWGWIDYKKLRAAPHDAFEINVIAKQWLWEFQYQDGRRLTNELVVPQNKPVKLIMTSQDVLHSFFVPNFRVKQDVIPNTYTSLWFEATQGGEHPLYCAEYCGAAHSGMLGKVRVLGADDFEIWQFTQETPQLAASAVTGTTTATSALNPADAGKILLSTKGCVACHTLDGRPSLGPTFKGVFGHEVELQDGKKLTIDENYIRESLMEPQAKIVKGFQPIMPTFKGQLTDDEINALIAYIKSLKGATP